jgi:hypothetical protein
LLLEFLKQLSTTPKTFRGKDVERMPYPWWVDEDLKKLIISKVEALVIAAKSGKEFSRRDQELLELDELFAMEA